MKIKQIVYKHPDLLCRLILILFGFVLMLRARYGFIWSDEGHYYAIAWRFVLGDRPMIHEWHVSQLHSILLVPYVRIMRSVLGEGMPGFLLLSRYLYTILQTIMGLCIYGVFRRDSRPAALAAGIIFMGYCKSNIMSFSYYSVFTFCFTGALLLQYRLLKENDLSSGRRRLFCAVSGLLWGFAIVCNPYSLLLFFINIAAILLYRRTRSCFLEQLLTGIFAAIPGVCTLLYISAGASLSQLIGNLSFIMSSDSGNYTQPLWYKAAWKIIGPFMLFRSTNIIIVLMICIVLYFRLTKRRMPAPVRYLLITVNHLILLLNLFSQDPSVTVLTAPALLSFTIWGLLLLVMSEHVTKEKLFLFYINGIVTAVFCGLSSDTGLNAMMQGYVISSIGLVMMLPEILPVFDDLFRRQRTLMLTYMLAPCLLAGALFLTQRITRVYRDLPLTQLDTVIEKGPGAGIVTSAECSRRYGEIYDTLDDLQGFSGDLYLSGLCPWAYLCTDMKVGSFTTWRITLDEQNSKGMEYYALNQDKLPEVMLRINGRDSEYGRDDLDDITEGTLAQWAGKLDAEMQSEDRKNQLISKLLLDGYTMIPTPCGDMYVTPDDAYERLTELNPD